MGRVGSKIQSGYYLISGSFAHNRIKNSCSNKWNFISACDEIRLIRVPDSDLAARYPLDMAQGSGMYYWHETEYILTARLQVTNVEKFFNVELMIKLQFDLQSTKNFDSLS